MLMECRRPAWAPCDYVGLVHEILRLIGDDGSVDLCPMAARELETSCKDASSS